MDHLSGKGHLMDEEASTVKIDYIEGGLIDVTGLILTDLDNIDDSNFKHTLRRIVDDSSSSGPVAGFSSSI